MKSTSYARLSLGKTKNPSSELAPEALRWLLEQAAESYKSETEATHKIKDRIASVLGTTITPIAASIFYLASTLKGVNFGFWEVLLFWLPMSLAICGLLASISLVAYTLIRGFPYNKAPTASEINEFIAKHPDPFNALTEAHQGLLEEYSLSIDNNIKQNSKRSAILLNSQRLAFAALVFALAAIPKWLLNSISTPTEPQQVTIKPPIEISTESKLNKPITPPQKQEQQKQGSSNSPATTTNQQQAKPTFPKRSIAMDSCTENPPSNPNIKPSSGQK